MRRTLALALLLSAVGAAQGQGNSINAYNLDNVLYVDGVKYALSATGIQQAINDAVTAGGTKVILPPGTIGMGTTALNMHSGVCLIGAGETATILSYSGPTIGISFGDTTGTTGACVRDLQLFFTTAAGNSTGIRIHGYNDGVPTNTFYFNNFENIRIQFQTLTSGGAGIYATSDGTALATQVFLNNFRNIKMWGVDQAVICNGCEGNNWIGIQAYKSGITNNIQMFAEGTAANGAPTNDEFVEFRGENESGSINACYATTGSRNIVRLTCDSGVNGVAAVTDSSTGLNMYDISSVGTPTLGTISPTSTYRFNSPTVSSLGIGSSVSSYAGIATVRNGIPSDYAVSDQSTQKTGAVPASTIYSVPVAKNGPYVLTYTATISRAATTSSTLGPVNMICTDADTGNIVTIFGGLATANTTGTAIGGNVACNAKSVSNIQFSIGYSSSGLTSMGYVYHMTVSRQ